MPPITNIETNAMANSIGVLRLIEPPHIVPIQLNTLIPVGTAIIMVVTVKTEFATGPRPDCEHVVAPDHPSHERDDDARQYDGRISETAACFEKTGKTSRTRCPWPASIRMYTSGCPNTQNRCCQRTALAPAATLKKFIPKARSKYKFDQRDSYHRERQNQ